MKTYLNANWYLIDCALARLEQVVTMPWQPWHIERGFRNFDTNLYGISIKYFG